MSIMEAAVEAGVQRTRSTKVEHRDFGRYKLQEFWL